MYKPLKLNKRSGLEPPGWREREDNLQTEEERDEGGANMAPWNLWCEQADDGKQLVHPTASIQIWSVHPLFTCPFILSLPSSFGSSLLLILPNLHLLRKGKPSSSPPGHRGAAVLSGGLLYEVPLSALRASCSLCR